MESSAVQDGPHFGLVEEDPEVKRRPTTSHLGPGPQKPGYVKGDSDSSRLHLLLILVKNHDIEKIDANFSPLTFLTLPGHAM